MAGGGPAVAKVAEAALANNTQAERQGETMAMVAALESIPQMVRHRLGRNIGRVNRSGWEARAVVVRATRDANPTPDPSPSPNPHQVASPLCALAFTRMLSAPQFIFVAAAAPVLLALLLLASLRRASLRPHRDEGCAPPILVADPRRRLLLAGGDSDMVPTSPCATTAQSVLGPTPPTAAASGHQMRQTGES
jgi:hypothetical protein